jgi:hypothetical protein
VGTVLARGTYAEVLLYLTGVRMGATPVVITRVVDGDPVTLEGVHDAIAGSIEVSMDSNPILEGMDDGYETVPQATVHLWPAGAGTCKSCYRTTVGGRTFKSLVTTWED